MASLAWGLFALFVATVFLALHERGDYFGAVLVVVNIAIGIFNIQKALK
jgi:hypothetical protein